MFKMIKITICIILLFVSGQPYASEQVPVTPFEMVEDVANQTFLRIKNQRAEIEANPAILEDIVYQELLPHVDYKFSAYKVLGKHFKDYSKVELNAYIEAFKIYSVSVFSNALRYYKDQEVIFEPSRRYDERKPVVVRALVNEDGNSTKISFMVRKSRRLNKWLLYDISAEGVSMVSTLQSQFSPILRKEGLAGVIAVMSKS